MVFAGCYKQETSFPSPLLNAQVPESSSHIIGTEAFVVLARMEEVSVIESERESHSVVSDSFCGVPWTVACRASLSMEFSRPEYWSGQPFPPPGGLPNPGIDQVSCKRILYCLRQEGSSSNRQARFSKMVVIVLTQATRNLRNTSMNYCDHLASNGYKEIQSSKDTL